MGLETFKWDLLTLEAQWRKTYKNKQTICLISSQMSTWKPV